MEQGGRNRWQPVPMMRHEEHTPDIRTRSQAKPADRHDPQRARARSGTGFGDRFEDFQGRSGSVKAREQRGEKRTTLQGKRGIKRLSDVA